MLSSARDHDRNLRIAAVTRAVRAGLNPAAELARPDARNDFTPLFTSTDRPAKDEKRKKRVFNRRKLID